jgi:hypothetical protein
MNNDAIGTVRVKMLSSYQVSEDLILDKFKSYDLDISLAFLLKRSGIACLDGEEYRYENKMMNIDYTRG